MTKKCVKCVKIGTKKALHLPLQTSKSHEVARVSGEKHPGTALSGISTVEFPATQRGQGGACRVSRRLSTL